MKKYTLIVGLLVLLVIGFCGSLIEMTFFPRTTYGEIAMIQPNGWVPARDAYFAQEVNVPNSEANLNNSGAEFADAQAELAEAQAIQVRAQATAIVAQANAPTDAAHAFGSAVGCIGGLVVSFFGVTVVLFIVVNRNDFKPPVQ